ncbi:hypothetical protein [Thalassospira mesophila]|uniref:Uncharacterized protein n=1 Tax=Thalassospira mesophila TaxID=1293891 RepID=A0A1Y2L2J5_9PROT|nr:hypothetical protein [Thalassospira mesophila]OSQ38410.1 hypothetical protein TMES_11260 [Thalassospira mesophila]
MGWPGNNRAGGGEQACFAVGFTVGFTAVFLKRFESVVFINQPNQRQLPVKGVAVFVLVPLPFMYQFWGINILFQGVNSGFW